MRWQRLQMPAGGLGVAGSPAGRFMDFEHLCCHPQPELNFENPVGLEGLAGSGVNRGLGCPPHLPATGQPGWLCQPEGPPLKNKQLKNVKLSFFSSS